MTISMSLEASGGRYGLRQLAKSEVTKISTLRSTFWTLVVTVVGTLGVTVLATNSASHHSAMWYRGFDPTNQSMTGLAIGTLAIGILGVLSVTGEYGSGTIRSSLASTPRRPLFLFGKGLVIGAISLVVGEVLTFASFFGAVAPAGVCLALLGLVGFALGVIIRHTAGAISAFVGATFLLPVLLGPISSHPVRFTPLGILANSVTAVIRQPGQVSPAFGLFLMTLYCAAALAVAAVLFLRRDA
jgi:hypothetical protein